MSATVTALVRLLMGCIVMAFLIVFLVGCAVIEKNQRPPPPEEGRNVWREWLESQDELHP